MPSKNNKKKKGEKNAGSNSKKPAALVVPQPAPSYLVLPGSKVGHEKPKQNKPSEDEEEYKPISDDELFQPPPPKEECPICLLPLNCNVPQNKLQECCGKQICGGCYTVGMGRDHSGIGTRPCCPFCRMVEPRSNSEAVERLEKRCESGDAAALWTLGNFYRTAQLDLVQDVDKGFELLFRAAEMGSKEANHNIAYAYETGEGLEQDMKKAVHLYKIAAMGGSLISRHNLGCMEVQARNYERAVKHWMISASAGFDGSMDCILTAFQAGDVAKDDCAKCLRAHHEASKEMKSGDRERSESAVGGSEGVLSGRTLGEATFREELKTMSVLRQVPSTAGEPTTCVELSNMVRDDLKDDAKYAILFEETRQQCMIFGALQKVIIPRAGPGASKIFLEYSTAEEAGRVIAALGCIGPIEAVYCDPECLSMHNWFMSIQPFATQDGISHHEGLWKGM